MNKTIDLWNKKELRYFTYFVLGSIALAILLWAFKEISIYRTLRATFGFFLIMILPGYLAVPIFFSKKEIGTIEQIGLTLVFSIVFVTLSVMFTNYFLKVPVNATNIILIILVICLMFIAIRLLQESWKKYKTKK